MNEEGTDTVRLTQLTSNNSRPALALPAVYIDALLGWARDRHTTTRAAREPERPPQSYTMFDGTRLLGTITAPRSQPAFGAAAPTVLLQRSLHSSTTIFPI
ncbi:MAG: hypothetical protein A2W29_02725 [Gemmatimonadetes bacterium RBG_16_66_8]|nr:MAG: hypothetical protein A2W29_02725 [Gemmatimonadetes bacterium RBG_16_66_8]